MIPEGEPASEENLRNVAHRMMILSGMLLLSVVFLIPMIWVGLLHRVVDGYLVTFVGIALLITIQIGIMKIKYGLEVKWRGIEASFPQYIRHSFPSVLLFDFTMNFVVFLTILQPFQSVSPIVLIIGIDSLFAAVFLLMIFSLKKSNRLPKNYRLLRQDQYPNLVRVIESTSIPFRSIGFLDRPGLKIVNAFQTGIGSNSIIALYDELENVLDEEEMTAIAAHELGHVCYRHVEKILISIMIPPLILVNVCLAILGLNLLSILNDIQQTLLLLGLFLLALGPSILLVPWLTRRWETQADLFAASLVGKETIIAALRKITEQNIVYANIDKRLEFLISHPILETRVKNISQED